jgi:hypothetical protein
LPATAVLKLISRTVCQTVIGQDLLYRRAIGSVNLNHRAQLFGK